MSITGAFLTYGAVALSATPRVMLLFPQLRRMGVVFVGAHVRALNAIRSGGFSEQQRQQEPVEQAHSRAPEYDHRQGATLAQQASPQPRQADARLAALEQRLEALLDFPERDAGQINRILAEMDRVRANAAAR